jgi:hypothetical protein
MKGFGYMREVLHFVSKRTVEDGLDHLFALNLHTILLFALIFDLLGRRFDPWWFRE